MQAFSESGERYNIIEGTLNPLDNVELENGAAMRDTIFDRLVSGESDVVGLLAYSLSMQNKRDWLAAFQAEAGRPPSADEMTAYDIGERIERRLATYRKLAEHALSGNSFWASASLTPVSEFGGVYAPPSPAAHGPPPEPAPVMQRQSPLGSKIAIAGCIFIVLVIAAFAARQWIGV